MLPLGLGGLAGWGGWGALLALALRGRVRGLSAAVDARLRARAQRLDRELVTLRARLAALRERDDAASSGQEPRA
jgi:hypothetical protein